MPRIHVMLLTGLAILPSLTETALAQIDPPEFYGRINVNIELDRFDGEGNTSLVSNNSRIGVRGGEQISEGYEAVYQLEYKVSPEDESTFSQRNSFLGVRSDWGTVTAGYFDTPFKRSQGAVDVFNDLKGDITRALTIHERRESNSIMYTSPADHGPFLTHVAYIAHDDRSRPGGVSAMLSYDENNLYTALAVNRNVQQDDEEAARVVAVYTLGQWQFGALAETSDRVQTGSESGWMLSTTYRADERWTLKAQAGQSDIRFQGGESYDIGADYRISGRFKVFGFLTLNRGEPIGIRRYGGLGAELRF
ncbi:MAG: porin [Pseudohongiellaceae bacterium]